MLTLSEIIEHVGKFVVKYDIKTYIWYQNIIDGINIDSRSIVGLNTISRHILSGWDIKAPFLEGRTLKLTWDLLAFIFFNMVHAWGKYLLTP